MQAQLETCSISSKRTLGSKRDEFRKKIRREKIDSIFKETRSVLINGNSNCQIEAQHNTQLNYNFILPIQNYSHLQCVNPPVHNPQPLFSNWPFKQSNIKRNLPEIKCDLSIKQQLPKMNPIKPNRNILSQGNGFSVFKKVIGQGTYSKVYEGQEDSTKMKVAIKVIKELQQNQIRCLTDCTCPYIVKMYTYWKQGAKTYLVLEMCDRNLRQQMKTCSKQDLIRYFIQILEGMNVLVKRRIIHRDVKFENILIKNGVAKITDFGLAKPLGNQLSVQSLRCGTPYTMAPEILFHSSYSKPTYTSKCDIWSLGVLLHEMLYERHPFDYSQQKMLRRKRVSINRKFPAFDNFIDQALIFEQKQRMNWTTVQQMIQLFKNPIAMKKQIKNNYQAQEKYQIQNPQRKQYQPKVEPFKKKPNPYLINLEQYNQNKNQLKQNLEPISKVDQPKLVKNFINMGYFKENIKQEPICNIVEQRKFKPLRKLNAIAKQSEESNKNHIFKKKQQFKTPQKNRHMKAYKITKQIESSAESSESTSIYSQKDIRKSVVSFQNNQKPTGSGIKNLLQAGTLLLTTLLIAYFIL